jgi:hypothetical protein
MSGGIKVNENWRKRYSKVVMLLSVDLVTISFVRVSRLHWIGYVNKKESKRKVSQVNNSNPQGSRLRKKKKTRWWNCLPTVINKRKIKNWRGKKQS